MCSRLHPALSVLSGTVTFLTAGAVSFFSRGVRVKGQPSPEDIACGVFVGLDMVSACPANEDRLCDAIFLGCVSTVFAAICGVAGINLNQAASSVFRFGAQN